MFHPDTCQFERIHHDIYNIAKNISTLEDSIFPAELASSVKLAYANFLQDTPLLRAGAHAVTTQDILSLKTFKAACQNALDRFDHDVELRSLPMDRQYQMTHQVEDIKSDISDALKASKTCVMPDIPLAYRGFM